MKFLLKLCVIVAFFVSLCVNGCLSKINCADVNIDITEGTKVGSSITFDGVTFKESEYFRDDSTGKTYGCICEKKTCVYKCCPEGFGYDPLDKTCVVYDEEFRPPVWNDVRELKVNVSEFIHFYTEDKIINCTAFGEYRLRSSKLSENRRLQLDGNYYLAIATAIPPYRLVRSGRFCIDHFVSNSDEKASSMLDALICLNDDEDENYYHYITAAPCMLISCVFILATVAVYTFIPELRTLHGRVLVTYLMSLFMAFLFLSIMKIMILTDTITADSCLVFTFIIYFSLETSFAWLTVMSFDVWWTFSGKRGLSIHKMSIRGRYIAYALFAFGIPTLLTVLVAALEFADLEPHELLPLIRIKGCFINGYSKHIYLYGPMLILCIVNTTFFFMTAIQIGKSKRHTSTLKSNESTTNTRLKNDKQRLLLYVKLFFLMGINWILEIISDIYPQPKILWYIIDAYNVLIGVTIFVFFVWKRKIVALVKKRIRQLRGETISRAQTTTTSRASRDDQQMMTITPVQNNLT